MDLEIIEFTDFGDKSSLEAIREEFQVSKKVFK
jgi:predicted RNA-binding protein (virulence factor B family)